MRSPISQEIDAALAGDVAAVERLFSLLTPVLTARIARTFLTHRLGGTAGRNVQEEVADLVPEVFVHLFANEGKVLRSWQTESGLTLEEFVGLVAERQIVSVQRKRYRGTPWKEDPALEKGDDLFTSADPDSFHIEVARDQMQPTEVEAASRVAAVRKFRKLLDFISSEAVEDCVTHPAEGALIAYLNEYRGWLPWLEVLGTPKPPASRFADFLRLAGRVRPENLDLRERLLREGLASDNVEVRDAAVQAAELWEDPQSIAVLRGHQEELPWLADYIQRVLKDIVD